MKRGLRYHHIGIPTSTPHPNEVHLQQFKMYAAGCETNPYGVEWLRFDAPEGETEYAEGR